MKKSWIVILLSVAVVFGAVYQLVSNKAELAEELAARKRTVLSVPVTVIPVEHSPVSRSFQVDGVLSAKDQITILSETNGQVQRLYREIGDAVEIGSVLAQADSHVLATQLEMAKTSLANNERDLARFENLLKSGAASQQTVDNLKLAVESARATVVSLEKQLANSTVKSPLRGTVTARYIEKGSVLGAGVPTYTVADLSAMLLTVGLTEKEMTGMHVGLSVDVKVDAIGKIFAGTVRTVGVSANQSGRYPVEVQLAGFSKGELRPDLSASAVFKMPALDNLPVIPRKALVAGLKDPKVYVVQGDKAMLRPITLALAAGGEVVVAQGLQKGEKVVVTGQFNLVDGTLVKVME